MLRGVRTIPLAHPRAVRPHLQARGMHSLARRSLSYPASNALPASFLRGGTSKGIFLHRHDLPTDMADWPPVLLGLMGSPDPQHGRQLNGMGGGVSSLSKVCVVQHPNADQRARGINVVYTFVQVGIRDAVIDLSGNCGNLSSMIGVFALDEGVCIAEPGQGEVKVDAQRELATVRSFNTNTQKIIDTTFPVSLSEGKYIPLLDLEQAVVAGVPGKASQIILEFVNPAGARTGELLPSGKPVDVIDIETSQMGKASVRVSLVDATNPTVFVSEADLRTALSLPQASSVDYTSDDVVSLMESIRRQGATLMRLDPDTQAQPKVAAVSAPDTSDTDVDVVIHAFSMGVLHKAVPMTVGLCLGVAGGVRGTLPWELAQAARKARGDVLDEELLTMRHPGGVVEAGASFDGEGQATSAKVMRTGRRLMKGVVWWR